MIKEDFINNFPIELGEVVRYVCDQFFKFNDSALDSLETENYEKYIEYFILLDSFLKSHNFFSPEIKFVTNNQNNIIKIIDFFNFIFLQFQSNSISNKKNLKVNNHLIAFNKGNLENTVTTDYDKLQIFINKLRDNLLMCSIFSIEHKSRLLSQLGSFNRKCIRNFISYTSFGILAIFFKNILVINNIRISKKNSIYKKQFTIIPKRTK